MPPCAGKPLYKCVIQRWLFNSTTLSVDELEAANFFVKVQKFTFTKNFRSKEDPAWATMIASMRTLDHKAFPIRDVLVPQITSGQLVLTAKDITDDPEFLNCTIYGCSNRQRALFVALRAIGVATRLGVPVIRWRKPFSGQGSYSRELLDRVYEDNPILWTYFIPGSEGYIVKSIRPARGISNGTKIRFHSITLGTPVPSDSEYYSMDSSITSSPEEDEANIETALPGQVVTISPPTAVNVLLCNKNPRMYEDITVVPGEAVISLKMAPVQNPISLFVPTVGKMKLKIIDHGVESALGSTVNKGQGQTVSRAIGCLNATPTVPHHSFSSIFVMVSRVMEGKNFKVLPSYGDNTWKHLHALKPDPDLQIFMSAFDKKGYYSNDAAVKKAEEFRITASRPNIKGRPNRNDRTNPQPSDVNLLATSTSTAHVKRPPKPPSKQRSTADKTVTTTVKSTSYFLRVISTVDDRQQAQCWFLPPDEQQRAINIIEYNLIAAREGRDHVEDAVFNDINSLASPRDVASLYRDNWLTNHVIADFCKTICPLSLDTRPCFVMHSGYYQSLIQPSTSLEDKTRIIRRQYGSKYLDGHRGDLLVIIHLPGHWIYGILSFRLYTILIHDSMGIQREIHEQNLRLLVQDMYSIHGRLPEYDATQWTLQRFNLNNAMRAPQTDGTSCGVFVCAHWLYWVLTGAQPSHEQFRNADNQLFRLYIAITIRSR